MRFRPYQFGLGVTVNLFVSAMIRKRHRKLDRLSNRVAWMTSFGHDLLASDPAFGAMLDGGIGARKVLEAIETVIRAKQHIDIDAVTRSFDEIDQFLADAEKVMTAIHADKPAAKRLFKTQSIIRNPF